MKLNALTFTICFSMLLNSVTHGLFFMGFPLIGKSMNISITETGFILSVSSLFMMSAVPFWGNYIDRNGPIKPIKFSIVSYGFCLVLTGLSFKYHNIFLQIFYVLLSIRIIQAILTAGFLPSAQTYISLNSSIQKRTSCMGIICGLFGIGTIISGFIIMFLNKIAYINTILILGILNIFMLFLYNKYFKNILKEEKQKEKFNLNEYTNTVKMIFPCVLTTPVFITIYGFLQQTIGVRFQTLLSLSTSEALKYTGFLMMITTLFMSLGQIVLFFIKIKNPKKVLYAGMFLTLLGLIMLMSAKVVFYINFSMIVIGIGMSLVFPSNLALISFNVSKEKLGIACSLNVIGQSLGLTIGPFISSILYQKNYNLPIIFSIGLIVILVIILKINASIDYNKLQHNH